ncbi:hypothetical protein ACIBHX_02055 [Nonomuraea sp. NPDC050536]|uniref:hypothetical protein n=1 Tax=Nonomuraea sp. NPDC050536 TaxID=3364366 RepID=UPI0037CAAF86
MSAVDDLKAKVRRPEKTVSLCLAGDLQAEFEDLERELAAARDQPSSGTLAGGSAEAAEIARRIQALQAEMREHSEVFKFRGLTRREHSDLVARHPPTEEQLEQSPNVDVNWETYGVALIAACCVSHPMTEAEAGELVDILTTAQYSALYQAASAVNILGLDIPNSFTASAVLQGSKRNSK